MKRTSPSNALKTGAQIVWESLMREGVDVLFGYPGGAIMPVYDALLDYPVHHVLMRHEENAAFAADGYARASGKVGVCMATSGPGATNLVTGLTGAMMDSIPVVAITGQVASHLLGTDAFQETDVTGITLPVTKHNYLVTDVTELAADLKEAFHIARSGRPGPVLVDVCKDVQFASTEYDYDAIVLRTAGFGHRLSSGAEQIRRAAALINNAQRPIVLAGHGIILSGAHDELRALAEKGQIPVSTTLLGIGSLPESHPLNLRMMGMHGEAFVNEAIQAADLLIALGMRFDDRVTGNLATYAQHADIIHVDIDPAEIGKIVTADVGIVGDVREVLGQLLPLVEPRDRSAWISQIETWRTDTAARDILSMSPEEMAHAPYVIDAIRRSTEDTCATIVSDVGQNQMWAAQYYRHEQRNRFFTSGGLASMGYGVPAAIGAQFARPGEEVWAIVGDGGFQMSIPELATIVQERLPVKIAVMRNGYLGMVRQWQELMNDRRYSEVKIEGPDLVKLAAAYGVMGMRAEKRAHVEEVIAEARTHPGPVLMDFVVEEEANVYPMVGPGSSLNKMFRRPADRRSPGV